MHWSQQMSAAIDREASRNITRKARQMVDSANTALYVILYVIVIVIALEQSDRVEDLVGRQLVILILSVLE